MKLFDIYEELKHGFRMTATMRRTLIITMALAVISPAIANELRVWTSRQGSSIDAKLLKYEGKEAHLVTADTKVIKIKSADLSLSDRQYLVEFAAADSAILSETELGVPEKDVRISSKDFVRLDDKLWLGQDSEVSFDLLQTDHFLIATDGKVRPQALAEMSERLWHGMAFMHMDFRENWGDKRMLVVATSDESVYLQTGEWYIGTLRARDADEYADNVERTWALSASTRMTMTDEIIEKYKLHPSARVFHARDTKPYSKVFGPFPTHGLASSLLNQQLGGVSEFGSAGFYAITTGHAFYKEIQLAGKTETSLLNAGDYDNDEIATTRGFADGTSWAKTLKKMVRKDEVKPDLNSMFTWTGTDLTPERLVLMYSFGFYLQSTPARASAFATLARRIETSDQVPPIDEIAKFYGFENADAFQADWIEFIKSTEFK